MPSRNTATQSENIKIERSDFEFFNVGIMSRTVAKKKAEQSAIKVLRRVNSRKAVKLNAVMVIIA